MKKILIPVDGSEFSMRAVEKGVEIAKSMNSEIVLLSAGHKLTFDEDKETELEAAKYFKRRSEEVLSKGKEILEGLNFTNYKLVSEIADVSDAIINYAKTQDMDLIIMGSQGLNAGRIKGIFIGSITRKVIYQTDLPVLVVK